MSKLPEMSGEISRPAFWMIVSALALFWLPLVGPFATGAFGAALSKKLWSTIVAAIVPAIVLVGIVVICNQFFGLPFLGHLQKFTYGLYMVFHVAALFGGVVVGVKFIGQPKTEKP